MRSLIVMLAVMVAFTQTVAGQERPRPAAAVGHPSMESPHVNPIAVSGGRVFVANTPAGTGDVISRSSLHGKIEVADYLIENGAAVSGPNEDGNTPLHAEAFLCRTDIVNLLLEKGAAVTAKNRKGETPIDVVSGKWSKELGDFYTGLGAATGSKINLKQIEQNRPKIAKLLCAHAEQPNEKSEPNNFSRFRGPNADGVCADDSRLPDKWSKTENVKWVIDVPGRGWSSPVAVGNKVFVTSVVNDGKDADPMKGLYLGAGVKVPPEGEHHWLVHCFDLKTGKLLWKYEAHKGKPTVPRHPKSSYAAETPTTDGERVYALFGDVGLYCYDLDGKQLWKHDIAPKKTFFNYGAAASPVVHDGQVFVLYDNQEKSYLASFDAKSGQQLWRTERDETSTWATPFIWKHKLRTEIVTCGKKKNRAYDLSGKLLWEFDGKMSGLVIPSPFAADGLLYITSGYVGDQHRPTYAVKPGASGDITLKADQKSNDFIAWYQPKTGPYNTTPLVIGGRYYTLHDQGFLACHDAKTGEELFGRERIGGSYTASPWAYNGMVFCLGEDGKTRVVTAGAKYELLHTNDLDELCIATPSVSQGSLLLRTASKLYCLTKDAKK